MSDNVQTAMFDILKKMQAENADFRKSVEQQFAQVAERFDRLEEINRKQRRDSAGMLVMMRATAGDFDQRINDVVTRMDAMEARRG
jgi:hypothetical protein